MIYHPTIGGSTAIATAISQGYFEEENLTVNLQMYTSGPPEIAAMVAKQADVGFIGSGAAWLAFSGQVNIIALDNIALTEEIITRADNGINSIADLKGKTVAVQEGAAGYTLLVVALQEAGISVSDVKILNISRRCFIASLFLNPTPNVKSNEKQIPLTKNKVSWSGISLRTYSPLQEHGTKIFYLICPGKRQRLSQTEWYMILCQAIS